MAIGNCFCGKIRIELNGPLTSGLCHCLDCRKLTSGPYSYNFIVKTADLTISGSPKEVAKTADSGNDLRNYFCPDCGTPLYGRKMKANGEPDEITIVRAGIFDDVHLNEKPQAEIYTDRRLKWVDPIEGAGQYSGMLPL
ncbi:hypothetical protein ASPWEDRAFT_646822 [Aspergillus wentii DTO 134E9]|uniref:CENP-V/GFA domain-containing protein n=1 Tax=Aspergillus wentii DTO 134E9 TaxID=1073089 RepID=A0A1L9RAS6_ASPWE|nr:uncharacterized protein ASPWEDRAFT_646822 [Aspergillus wentii DTO 134E9]KAI9934615.1 hypothetical protein MW887_000231 [Aspergillus wentii]OJJ32036.1 hypothetical protein ASPWEDRAFT_646822 [Aspergillus wentii DTO 134E9]